MLFEQAPLYLEFFGLGRFSSDELRPEIWRRGSRRFLQAAPSPQR
jgi:hypothetical protein